MYDDIALQTISVTANLLLKVVGGAEHQLNYLRLKAGFFRNHVLLPNLKTLKSRKQAILKWLKV